MDVLSYAVAVAVAGGGGGVRRTENLSSAAYLVGRKRKRKS